MLRTLLLRLLAQIQRLVGGPTVPNLVTSEGVVLLPPTVLASIPHPCHVHFTPSGCRGEFVMSVFEEEP